MRSFQFVFGARKLASWAVLSCGILIAPHLAWSEVDNNPSGSTITTGIGGSGTTISNEGTINISTSHTNAVVGTSADTTVTNSGTINFTGANNGRAINLNQGGDTVINTGTITTNGSYSEPIYMSSSATATDTVNNSGTLTNNGVLPNGVSNGIATANTGNMAFSITNSGTITAGGYGIYYQDVNGSRTTSAALTNTAAGSITSSYGVDADNSLTVNNAGVMKATVLGGAGASSYEGFLNLTNSGTGTISGDWGVQSGGANGGATTIVNYGTIATVPLTGGAGIAVDTALLGNVSGSTITNYGTLTGDVMLGTGNTLTLLGNSAHLNGNVIPWNSTSSVQIGNATTTANFTSGGSFGTTTGTQTREGNVYNTAPLGTFSIASGSTFNTSSGLNINAVYFDDAGTMNVLNAATITTSSGDTQTGALDIGIVGGTAGTLAITGAVTFDAGSSFGIAAGSSILAPGVYTDVLSDTSELGLPTSTTGTFDGYDYALNLESGSSTVWDLTITNESSIPAPEPTTLALLGSGMLGILKVRHRRGQKTN